MSIIISPTPGRVVWYHPGLDDPLRQAFKGNNQPLAAIVAHVWTDTRINLMVINPNGESMSRHSVLLHQGSDSERPVGTSFAEWMPYQKGQAAKADATQADTHATRMEDVASRVLYPAIYEAMKELGKLPPGLNGEVDRAFNHLHKVFWSECPAPVSAAPLRPVRDTAESTVLPDGSAPLPAEAKASGLVVVFGYSDDNAELRHAIHDEVSMYSGVGSPSTTKVFCRRGMK